MKNGGIFRDRKEAEEYLQQIKGYGFRKAEIKEETITIYRIESNAGEIITKRTTPAYTERTIPTTPTPPRQPEQ